MAKCKCNESKRPFATDLPIQSNRRPRQWFVTRRNEACSAFEGYKPRWSDWSDVHCRVCDAYWRTKAAYVMNISDCEYFPRTHSPKAEPLDIED